MKLRIPVARWDDDSLMRMSDDGAHWDYEMTDEDVSQVLVGAALIPSIQKIDDPRTEEDKVLHDVGVIQETLRGNNYEHIERVIKILHTLHRVF